MTSQLKSSFTSESVTEGHPDKVCDFIADAILDAQLEIDPQSRVACEVLCKSNTVVLAGEITSQAEVDYRKIVCDAVRQIGYIDANESFCADTLFVQELLTRQAPEINQGVDGSKQNGGDQGAGDQGIMFGFATNETPELMPLSILLAHRLARGLAQARKGGEHSWLRPDGKTQVTVAYEGNRPVAVTDILISTQHDRKMSQEEIAAFVSQYLLVRTLGDWFNNEVRVLVNPTGSFIQGGPSADCGVTGRKIIVDTYGGAARHGGGAFSGKDPSKVDRSGAYFSRYVARQLIKEGLAARAEIQVAYAIGKAKPIAVNVNAFGTGDERHCINRVEEFDFRPEAIIEQLDLLRPIYRTTTNYGHFGKPGLTWEQ